MICIKNGTLHTAVSKETFIADILIDGGKIVKIGKYYYRYGADGRFVKRSKTRSKLIPKKKHSKRHLSD